LQSWTITYAKVTVATHPYRIEQVTNEPQFGSTPEFTQEVRWVNEH